MSMTVTQHHENDEIELDVGGSLYKTSIRTLTRVDQSVLGRMFSGSGFPIKERCFIDRDGPMFRYVLNYLRNNALVLDKDYGVTFLMALQIEAEYFALEGMASDLEELIAGKNKFKVETMEQEKQKMNAMEAAVRQVKLVRASPGTPREKKVAKKQCLLSAQKENFAVRFEKIEQSAFGANIDF